jgi:hydroxymethylglutaryl-CoA lyase
VKIVEVGPREGFQFEGIRDPNRISVDRKIELIERLSHCGLQQLQIVSFVHPRIVPQMADAEEICRRVRPAPGVTLTGIYLNDTGLNRALAAPALALIPELVLSASESFALRNQKRSFAEDEAMQRQMAALYQAHGMKVDTANIMAAFGCNYEGEIPLSCVLDKISLLAEIAAAAGGGLRHVLLADTMGWANPQQIKTTVAAFNDRFPGVELGLHLHDTRGLGIANVYAALTAGVSRFDAAVGGLGGCPFAGITGAAGNVATEEVVFLCQQLGIETGVDLEALIGCAKLAEEIVGHPLPGKLRGSATSPAATAGR